MKKILLLLLVAGIAGSSMACDSSTDANEQVATTPTVAAEQTEADDETEASTELLTEEVTETEQPTEAEAPEETEASTPAGELTVEEQVIVDQDDVKITVTGFTDHDIWGEQLDLTIENGTDLNLRVSLEYLTINNYMMTDLFAPSVAAGKSSKEALSFSGTSMEAAGIDEIAEITFAMNVYDEDTYDDLFITDEIVIQTSLYDGYTPAPREGGTELYNADGIEIYYFPLDEDLFGIHLPIFIKNDSETNITVSADDLSVNDFMVTVLYFDSVNAGRMGLGEMMLSSSGLEELEIESMDEIESLEFTFRVYDSDSYDDIFQSDPIIIDFE